MKAYFFFLFTKASYQISKMFCNSRFYEYSDFVLENSKEFINTKYNRRKRSLKKNPDGLNSIYRLFGRLIEEQTITYEELPNYITYAYDDTRARYFYRRYGLRVQPFAHALTHLFYLFNINYQSFFIKLYEANHFSREMRNIDFMPLFASFLEKVVKTQEVEAFKIIYDKIDILHWAMNYIHFVNTDDTRIFSLKSEKVLGYKKFSLIYDFKADF